jgi:hypothetical protein
MLLRETLRELGQADEISEVEVSDPAQTDALNFPGSPTIRVNGIDVDTTLPRQNSYGLSCRTYLISGRVHGLPRCGSECAFYDALLFAGGSQRRPELPVSGRCWNRFVRGSSGYQIVLLVVGFVQLYWSNRSCQRRSPVSIVSVPHICDCGPRRDWVSADNGWTICQSDSIVRPRCDEP